MAEITGDIRRRAEDQYFLKEEHRRLGEARSKSAREAEIRRLMDTFGIRNPELVNELAGAGFDTETFRLLYLTPLIQVAWSDGEVSQREKARILELVDLHGIKPGSAAHDRLLTWLSERPSDRFFQTCLRGVKAMLQHRPASEAKAMRGELVWYCTQIASATGGFLGLGSRISREEELLLAELAKELDSRHHAAVDHVTEDLAR